VCDVLSFRGDHLISWKVIFYVEFAPHAGNGDASVQREIVAGAVQCQWSTMSVHLDEEFYGKTDVLRLVNSTNVRSFRVCSEADLGFFFWRGEALISNIFVRKPVIDIFG